MGLRNAQYDTNGCIRLKNPCNNTTQQGGQTRIGYFQGSSVKTGQFGPGHKIRVKTIHHVRHLMLNTKVEKLFETSIRINVQNCGPKEVPCKSELWFLLPF